MKNENTDIVIKAINDIKPYIGSHDTDGAVGALARSLELYGIQQPIVIDKAGNIVAGNCIWKAAKMLGLAEVPTLSVDALTDEEVAQYRIADNKTSEFASWNEGKLKKELSYLGTPQELQFCFDEDITRMLNFNGDRYMRKDTSTPPNSGAANEVPQSTVAPQPSAPVKEKIPTQEEIHKAEEAFRENLKREDKAQEVSQTEYFTFTCSKCGKEVTIRKR